MSENVCPISRSTYTGSGNRLDVLVDDGLRLRVRLATADGLLRV